MTDAKLSYNALETAIEDSWNAGRDPLDDPAICRLLDAHPEWLEALIDQRAALRTIASMPTPLAASPPQHRRWRLAAGLSAAGLVLAGWAFLSKANIPKSASLRPTVIQHDAVVRTRHSHSIQRPTHIVDARHIAAELHDGGRTNRLTITTRRISGGR